MNEPIKFADMSPEQKNEAVRKYIGFAMNRYSLHTVNFEEEVKLIEKKESNMPAVKRDIIKHVYELHQKYLND